MPMFHARLHPGAEAIGIRRCMRTEPVPRLIAVMAGSDDIGPVATTVLLGHQMLARGLQPACLAQG